MAKNKLKKFTEIGNLPFVFENADPKNPKLVSNGTEITGMPGNWRNKVFKNDNPLLVELACGRGEYTVALAEFFPNKNFIGLDIKGARIWQGATFVHEKGLRNAAFLRTRIEQLALFFGPAEIDEIWITFPDPFSRESKENRRLTSHAFLDRYLPLCKPGALVHLKTDDEGLYQFTLEVLKQRPTVQLLYHHDDIYASTLPFEELKHKTYYERAHLAAGKTIKYIRFTL